MWRMMRVVYKVFRDIYEQGQEVSSGLEDGDRKNREGACAMGSGRKRRLWELPLTPESTPRKNVSTTGKVYARREEEGTWRGFVPTSQTSGALGLIFEDGDDVFGSTRFGQRTGRAGGGGAAGKKVSLAAKVDRMKRRAQSEPLF